MKTIVLDLTDCKSLWEMHERIRTAFHFPEWYGKNWSAFWDLLWSECDADQVIIKGEHTLCSEYKEELEILHRILEREIAFRNKYGKNGFAPFSYVIEN